jgi:hypothetical protein
VIPDRPINLLGRPASSRETPFFLHHILDCRQLRLLPAVVLRKTMHNAMLSQYLRDPDQNEIVSYTLNSGADGNTALLRLSFSCPIRVP